MNTTPLAPQAYKREDFQMKALATELGWTVVFHEKDERHDRKDIDDPARTPHFTLRFQKDKTHIWYALQPGWSQAPWVAADLVNDAYTGHRHYDTLEGALRAEERRLA